MSDIQPSAFTVSDQQLQAAATQALGEREGAILVIDPHTGRIRAAVNPRIAIEQSFPPGSAIKPFTALAALRNGTLESGTQRKCNGRYVSAAFSIICSHPHSNGPLDFTQALAYSCNDYFAHVGERLNASAYRTTLAGFGFGTRTGVNAGNENAGILPQEYRVQEALGESEQLLVTPLQLLVAYSALVNGGKLWRPQMNVPIDAAANEQAQLKLATQHRTALLSGMRGAVKYGTAERAELDKLPPYIFGKTGTSTMSNGFRTQGWFVGFVAAQPAHARPQEVPLPEQIHLGVLVFLKRAHGAEGAMLLREMLGTLDGQSAGELQRQSDKATEQVPQQSAIVKVHLVTENVTQALPLEDYVTGVVAAEGSVEDQLEALKALAVVSRTYALKNDERHAADGYDFCSTTHCQRFWPQAKAALRRIVSTAVAQTAGEVLHEKNGQLADVYFSAACGGMTADVSTLWNAAPLPYLRGVADEYCTRRPNRNWTQAISANELARALRTDVRTDVGNQVRDLTISKRDATGRAHWVEISGTQHKRISGWEFKMIVGRSLGWHLIKSSMFTVRRAGTQFVFTGHGFGHGLGLCQEGAHVMAEQQMHYRAMLAHYLPGLHVENGQAQGSLPMLGGAALVQQRRKAGSVQGGAVIGSENVTFRFPPETSAALQQVSLRQFSQAYAALTGALAQSGLQFKLKPPIEIIVHASTADFIQATGRSGWTAAVTTGRQIDLQPLALLQKRGILAATLKHELTHVFVNDVSAGQAPRWLSEGLAIHYAGEGASLQRLTSKQSLTLAQLEAELTRPATRERTRQLYVQAYIEVQKLLSRTGARGVWQRVAQATKATK